MKLKGYFDHLKEHLGEAKYFLAALPAIPNEQARENASAAINMTKAELDKYTSNLTQQFLTGLDSTYHLNASLGALQNFSQANLSGLAETANRLNGLFDANGQLNSSLFNNIFSGLEPMIKERLMGSLHDLKPYLMEEMKPYLIMGFAGLFATIFTASYLGNSLAMRRHRKMMGWNPEFYKSRKKKKDFP